mgnify:CR=1 FL=1
MFFSLLIHLGLGFFLTRKIGVFGLGISLCIALIFWNIFSAKEGHSC